MRDNFSPKIKELLAKRVGYRCSNPKCRQLTCGPQDDQSKTVNVGVAAHITAASPKGPRFNGDITSDERKVSPNGIWLCQKCAKLVDNDHQRHSTSVLSKWKKTAEDAAINEIEGLSAYAINEGKPYLRFSDELVFVFRTPSIDEFIAMLPQYLNDDGFTAGKVTEKLKLLNVFEQRQFCQNFRMVCLKLSVENVGSDLASDIKLYWDDYLFFTCEAIKPGEKIKKEDFIYGNLSMSSRNKDGVASATAPPKNLIFWESFIVKIQEFSIKSKAIGSDLEIIYKIHKRKIPISLKIEWKALSGEEYNKIAKTYLFWNGSCDQIEPWIYEQTKWGLHS
jgi:hypothetical protein